MELKLSERLTTVLDFFSLLDDQNRLSITNIAVIILVTKVAMAPLDWPTASALLMTLVNYGHKRMTNAGAANQNSN